MKKPTPQDYGLTDEDVQRLSKVEDDRRLTCKHVVDRVPEICRPICWIIVSVVVLYCLPVPENNGHPLWLKAWEFFAMALFWSFSPSTFIAIIVAAEIGPVIPRLVDRWSRFIVYRRNGKYFHYLKYTVDFRESESNQRRLQKDKELTEQRLRREMELTQQRVWKGMDGRTFELEVKNLIVRRGNKAELTGGSNDKGVDIVLDDGTVVQCKAHKNPVSPAVARELYGAMTHFAAPRGILVSLNDFTNGVIDFVRDKPIQSWDVNDLVRMQMRVAG